MPSIFHKPSLDSPSTATSYVMSFVAVAACTLLTLSLRHLTDAQNLAMAYLVCVVFIAARYGRWPSIIAALMSGAAFNFFFVEPYYTFNMADQKYYVTMVFLLLAGLITSSLTSRLREQSVEITSQHQALNALYETARELASAEGKQVIAEIVRKYAGTVLAKDAELYFPTEVQDEAAKWALSHGVATGHGTATLPSATRLYMPLQAQGRNLAVLALDAPAVKPDNPLLTAYASLFASAIARADAAQLSEKHSIEVEREKLRSTLLSAVSHDLRTPLATITGSASSLLLKAKELPAFAVDMIESIHKEAARLGRLVTNLLDATRMEAGALTLNREPYYIAELIGSALSRLEPLMGNRQTDIRIADHLPLLSIDGVLIEQVVMNLLENALRHTPDGSALTISAGVTPYAIEVVISDQGPGLKLGSEQEIFERYKRLDKKGGDGMGLGLAICKGIVEAHGGNIWARNHSEHGAEFHFTLPLALNLADVTEQAA
jgi:two-component system sensor histidine kinase KdpD